MDKPGKKDLSIIAQNPRKLGRGFFNRPTLEVSRDILGKFIVRNVGGKRILGIITETEAYIGPSDRAAHSFLPPSRRPQKWSNGLAKHLSRYAPDPRGVFLEWARTGAKVTSRTIAEYLDGGHIYIYLVYGMYWNMNFSTAGRGIPECVLIRAVFPAKETQEGIELIAQDRKKADGPGKLCNYLRVDKSFYGEDLADSKRIWLEDRGLRIPREKIKKGPRVGIDYAGPYWAKRHWRFWVDSELLFSSKIISRPGLQPLPSAKRKGVRKGSRSR
jgi:DNA-3-methyladenine glycosylase